MTLGVKISGESLKYKLANSAAGSQAEVLECSQCDRALILVFFLYLPLSLTFTLGDCVFTKKELVSVVAHLGHFYSILN